MKEIIFLFILFFGTLYYILFLQKTLSKNLLSYIIIGFSIYIVFFSSYIKIHRDEESLYLLVILLFVLLFFFYICMFFFYRKMDSFILFKNKMRLKYTEYLYKIFFDKYNNQKYLPFSIFILQHISLFYNSNRVFPLLYKLYIYFSMKKSFTFTFKVLVICLILYILAFYLLHFYAEYKYYK